MVGESVCSQDIVKESDPHQHYSSEKYWTHSGYEKNLHLQDGPYFVTIRALNNVVFGGALVTTVCHSTPFTVDTTAPIFTKVLDIFYDEDFDLFAVYFNASDPLSHLAWVDFGLGKTKHDVTIRGYEVQTYVTSDEPFVAVEHLGLGHGIPAWLRLRAVNNVGLHTARHGDEQILIDLTPPNAGVVFDGHILDTDVDYQADTSTMCAEWIGFFDEDSGIRDYLWGVGTTPGVDDVVKYHNLTHHYKRSCVGDLTLLHNTTYYSTVKAYNAALNSKGSSGTSDGVLIDSTPPLPGVVWDGGKAGEDINFSSETAKKSCNWNNFTDPESHILKYGIALYINREHIQTFEVIDHTQFTERSIAMNHRDEVEFFVTAVNGAGRTVNVTSDGFLVDHTTPLMDYIYDTKSGKRFQSFNDHLDVSWLFEDDDSGIKEYKYFINKQHQGGKHKAWPTNGAYATTDPSSNDGPVKLKIDQLALVNGAKYSIVVTAINNVLLSTSHESVGVVVDETPPVVTKVVTKMHLRESLVHQRCQIPQTFVDVLVENAVDEETGIEKLEVAIGSLPGHNDIHHYLDAPLSGKIFFGDLDLGHGDMFYATARVKNNAGLSKMFYSDSVTVSVRPILTVGDGNPEGDEDYQSNLNIVKGFWHFSDTCSIDMVQWQVEDLLGNVIKEFEYVDENARLFFNDEFSLKNGFTYINIIKVRDALNRTFTSASDGITVRIQPPNPGDVRDGLYEDSNYQQSVTEISANWDDFGDETGDPTQTISYYEVAIGDDHRFPKTRSNIQYYFNVGLNRSHTFRYLNLTAQDVTYYVTVRGISVAGSQDEASSNGIKVGFKDQIVSGLIETPVVQSDTSKIIASWTEFQSDIGIKQYLVGVYSSYFRLNFSINENETTPCETVHSSFELLDEEPISAYGLNTLVVLQNLHLKHGHSYYVIVVAVNEADMCRSVTSSKILVDTTPPDLTSTVLKIGKVTDDEKDDIFVDESGKLDVTWENFTENESSIASFEVSLYKMSDCSSKTVSPELKIDSVLVTADTKTTMYQLVLLPKVFHFIEVTALNTAGLKSSIISSRFRLDESAPFKGDVKIAPNWFTAATFQSSKELITSWIAIARSIEQNVCPNQRVIFPSQTSDGSSWEKMTGLYSPEFVEFAENKAILTIGYNTAQTNFLRSGLQGTPFSMISGNYSVSFKAASGMHIITIISFSSVSQLFPTNYTPPYRTTIDEVAFNITITEDNLENETNSPSTQLPVLTTSTTSSITPADKNFANNNQGEPPNPERFGFGLSIMGTQQNGSYFWDAMFWVVGQFKKIEEWISLDTDPSESEGNIIFTLETQSTRGEKRHNIKLIVNGVIKAIATGIAFGDSIKTFINTVNDNYYEPTIENIFEPFRSEAIVAGVQIPTDQDRLCLHGSGFFDWESGIKEVWVGISDNRSSTDNVSPMRLYQSLCLPCEKECLEGCQETCHFDEFDLMKIEITGLNLLPTIVSSKNASENGYQIEESHTYYVTIEAVNFAGQSSFSRSNGIMIDTTPAVCEYVLCLDPYNSLEEPTLYIGTNNSVAAYWSCSDAESEVYSYSIGVGTSQNTSDLYNMTIVGLATKSQIHLEDGKLFIHGDTYYFNVWAYNGAGSPGKFSCKFTVELFPPDVENVTTKSLFEYHPTDENVDQFVNVSFTEFDDSVGVAWDSKEKIADIYEWGIGTGLNRFDILPMIRVGVTKAGQAEIIQGHVWFNGEDMNSTLSRFHDRPNDTTGGSLFLMEPGRCLHHSLIAVGRSHIRTTIPVQPSCITRPNDVRLMLNGSKNATLIIAGNGSIKRLLPRSTLSTDNNVAIGIKARSGGMMIGSLSNDDFTKNYGTDASDEFSSSIVDPKSTMMDTSRLLRNRLQGYQGRSFFISPMPFIEPSSFEITISMKINKIDYDNDTVPALALWSNQDRGKGKWLHVQEECDPDSISKMDNLTYLVTKVCHQTLVNKGSDNTRRKREVASEPAVLTSPYQFGLFKMRKSCVNTAPTIITDAIHIMEDTPVVRHQVRWSDAERDVLTFSSKQPTAGQVTVTDDGFLTFIPPQEFSGKMQIVIEAEETSVCVNKHSLSKVITIHVSSVDDAPLAGFLSHDNNFTMADHLDAEIVIFLEGNNTEHFVGSLLMVDADIGDNLRLVSRTMIQTDAILILEESSNDLIPNNTFTSIQSGTYKRIDFTLKTDASFSGHLHYQLLGSDRGGQMTARLDVHMFVLISPCNYGRCAQADLWNFPCNDNTRVFSFDTYTCECNVGYRSQWCDEEIDECASDPCPTLFDCTDHVAFHTCDINPGHLSAIILSIGVVVVGTCILLVYRYKTKKRFSIRDSSMWNLDDDKWTQGSASHLQPSIGSTRAIIFRADLVSEPSTDTQGEPPYGNLLSNPDPFHSKSKEMYPPKTDISPLSLSLDNQVLRPGMLRNPLELKSMWNLDDDKWTQGSASHLQPSIGSTRAIIFRADLVSEPSTDTQGEPPYGNLLSNPDPFHSKSKEMYPPKTDISPLSLSLDNQVLRPGMLRNPLELKRYQSMFNSGTNTVQLADSEMTVVDV
ncbi:Delta-like protein 1 [Mizuhopecten yessoensis]|uniref:Delta-like protein 1 n=1 Tax=Mizuhopecten yessoensis TaxID=6573 RepID=A0A210QH64_MIZYE|nr:Delta-like protein 1 [Mizuhopecten yessoensis]